MTERRRFNSRERVALFVAAAGRCERCGVDLTKGWHADHVIPWSVGGATDVINGAALCPPCNLAKGPATMTKRSDPPPINFRGWQIEALIRLRDHPGTDFLLEATPAAGKTVFALEAMRRANPDQVVVVVPRRNLRDQWTVEASKFGIVLDPTFENSHHVPNQEFDGIVVTYQAIAANPLIYRRYIDRMTTFVVLDEGHHCGDERDWGDKIRTACEPAHRRLMLSGTPFRSDKAPISFVTYEPSSGAPGELMSRPDFRYGYGQALYDGIVRPVEFAFYDTTGRWLGAGEIIERQLKDAGGDRSKALASALMPESDWTRLALTEAHANLDRIRRDVPDAGGLVVASTMEDARGYAKQLGQIAGVRVPVAVSDDPGATKIITDFAKSTAPWLVTVRMVSEGVDIPRLIVGVYANNIATETFFRQVVGRFIRIRGDESEPGSEPEEEPEADQHPAMLFLPSVDELEQMALAIEEERDHVIDELRDKIIRCFTEWDDDEEHQRQPVDVLPAIDGRHDLSVARGQTVTPADLAQAEMLMQRHGVAGTAMQGAMMLRDALGHGATDEAPRPPPASEGTPVLLHEQRKLLMKVLRPKVARFAKLTMPDGLDADGERRHHQKTWTMLNQEIDGKSAKQALLKDLRGRLTCIEKWIADADT